ncbi:hypothetical protein B7463_g8517, partial [Scytalidium lignicola]
MPLLNICAITGGNKVVQVGVAFLSNESEKSYKWVLSQLQEMMQLHQIQQPYSIITDRELALIKAIDSLFLKSIHILCRWHVNMNILAKTKKYFPGPTKEDGVWKRHAGFNTFLQACVNVFNSTTERDYSENLAELKKFDHRAVNYVMNTWLTPWKEKLMRYWVDQHLHFSVLVTSSVEGCHGVIKSWLQQSTRDLNGVFDRLELFWSAQQRGITEAVAQDQLRPKHNVNLPRFAELIGQIHGYALQKLHFEVSKLPKHGAPTSICNCTIQKSMGLPCYHTIWERIKDGGSVRIQDIHLHWLYYRSPEITQEPPLIQVLDPLVIRGKGRPKGALGQGKKLPESNTKRLPSAFELPSSTAPPAVDLSPIPKEQLYILQSTTQIAMARFEQGHIDQYEPGTMRERSYMRGISSVHKDDYMELSANSADSAMLNETQECIEVEVPGRLL